MIIATLNDYNFGQYLSLEKFKDCFTVGGGPRLGKNSHIFPFFFWETSLTKIVLYKKEN